jgi:CTP:molybdopterin cytidylyltransferase MocA
MYSSIKKGVFSLSGKKHFILQMIDQPFIGQDLYNKIIEKYDGESPLLQPVFNNKKGHPIIINKKLINLIKNDTSNSLREFLSPYYKDIQLVEYGKDTVLQNLNSYESFKKALTDN